MITFSSLWTKLRNRKYRKAFATDQLKRGVPFQINAIRAAFGWTQQELARRSGLPQGTISRAENMNYGDLSFNTVLQIAEGFDVAFLGRFVPFSELAQWYTGLPDQSFRLPTFDEENESVGEAQAGPRGARIYREPGTRRWAKTGARRRSTPRGSESVVSHFAA